MTTERTPTPVWHPTITQVTDSDRRNATNINKSPEDLGDNCQYLYNHRVRRGAVSDLAFVIAEAGDFFVVDNYGLYQAFGASAGINSPWEYPSSAVPGLYWRFSGFMMTNAARGLARVGPLPGYDAVTPEGRIPADLVQNRLLDVTSWPTGSLFTATVSAGTNQAFDSVRLEFSNCVAGDIITGSVGPIVAVASSTSNPGYVTIEVVDRYGTVNNVTEVRRCRVGALGGFTQAFPISFRRTVAYSGTTAVRLRAYAPSDVDLTVYSMDQVSLGTVSRFRP